MKNTKRITLAFLTLVTFQFQGTDLFAQAPTLQGPIPFIMIVSDTSASMEFTDKGSRYPTRVPVGSTVPFPSSLSTELNEWEPSTYMNIDPSNQSAGPKVFGSCIVWEPANTSNNTCGNYKRPSWNADVTHSGLPALNDEWKHQYNDSDTGVMKDRFINFMRGSASGAVRFDATDQPRHVTIKEVLTGDMILRPNSVGAGPLPLESYNRHDYGPGCWFVPRHRDASGQPDLDQNICMGNSTFEDLPDHTEPTPHFQEVYDGQLTNGLMDSLAGSAIFAVVGFDGYKDDFGWRDTHNNKINDDVGYNPGYTSLSGILRLEGGTGCTDLAGNAKDCYNLGVATIVAPKKFDIPSRFLPEVSRFSQVVLRDYGYLHEGINRNWQLSPKSSGVESERNEVMGETFSDGFDAFYEKHDLGKQPLAAATPIAAAMQDIRGFFDSTSGGQNGVDPVGNDDFKECRPKHVVLISDGAPSPERNEVNFTFDNNEEGLYPYGTSEFEISQLVVDPDNRIEPTGNANFNVRSSVRVHIVGMNIGDADAVQKLTTMAKAGMTCAGISLGANWQGDTSGQGCLNKLADPNAPCLIRPSAGNSYSYPLPDGTIETCHYPALILDTNDRDQLQAALSLLFNDIVDGAAVSTRTRTVITNEIQMEDTEPAGGQSRVFSGVVTGGSQYWKGILNRQTQSCLHSDYKNRPLHEDIGNQVSITNAGLGSDRRRVFTSLVSDRRYDYVTRAAKPLLNNGVSITGTNMFPSSFLFLKSGGQDEFRGTQISASPTQTLDTRIPFELSSINAASLPASVTAESVLNVGSSERAKEVINIFSARIPEKIGSANGGILPNETGRAMGGLLNSNPVLVAPPSLDLPIESYRQFKAHYADRHTMLYVNSMDGMLHAIHNGERDVQVRESRNEDETPGNDTPGDAKDMREAWAYIPQMFHVQLDAAAGSQAYLMDGTPAVQDVRLCRARTSSNFSSLCRDSAADGGLEPWEQWKTVLVQGAGLAGAGYYAMDITRPGGRTLSDKLVQLNPPDPVPLWELTPAYEEQQLKQIANSERPRIESSSQTRLFRGSCGTNDDSFATSSMMGISVSEPAIANVLMKYTQVSTSVTEQRPVVVFGGGAERPNSTGCAPTGGAIYVVDLQTGSIIRRFTAYFDASGNEIPFSTTDDPIQLTGSPALYDGSPGAVATRGFIGGSGGRLFRMDFVDANPMQWRVDLFFDPTTNSDVTTALANLSTLRLGPASFKPAVASTRDKTVIVTYGLGDPGDSVANNEAQVVIALRDRGSRGTTNADSTSSLEWVEALKPNEKLMGNPLTFDGATYWASYILPDGDSCKPGLARIYGVNFEGSGPNKSAVGIWDQVPSIALATGIEKETPTGGKWWGPSKTTLIRGLTLTLGNPCNVDNIGTNDPSYKDESQQRPQLIAQTSGQEVDSDLKNANDKHNDGLGARNPVVDRLIVNVKPVESKYQPLYWAAISY